MSEYEVNLILNYNLKMIDFAESSHFEKWLLTEA